MQRKVLVKGPALSLSGYGVHTRFILRALREYEHMFQIFVYNTSWGMTGQITDNDIERKWLDRTIEDTMHYISNGGQFDMSIQCTIPGEWEKKFAPYNVGCTAGTETTKISPEWLQKSNQEVDKIITVSNHASFAFLNTTYQMRDAEGAYHGNVKVDTPVSHVGYPVDEDVCYVYNPSTEDPYKFETDFNFLLMAQWSVRKNIENTVKWWIEEFIDKEDAGLIVKSSVANLSRLDRHYTEERLAALLSQYPDRKCKVYLLHGTLNNDELVQLYTNKTVKALISLSHGEGFGLPAFEAATNDTPVITTDWGGELDFLYKRGEGDEDPKKLFVDVEYDVGQIQPEAVWNTVLQPDSLWSFPKAGSFKMKLRSIYTDYQKCKDDALELGEYLREEFKKEKQYQKFVDALGVNLPKEEIVLEFD